MSHSPDLRLNVNIVNSENGLVQSRVTDDQGRNLTVCEANVECAMTGFFLHLKMPLNLHNVTITDKPCSPDANS